MKNFKKIIVKILNGCLMILPVFFMSILLHLVITNDVTEPIDFFVLLYICAGACVALNIIYAVYKIIKIKRMSLADKKIIDGETYNVSNQKKSRFIAYAFKSMLKIMLIGGIVSWLFTVAAKWLKLMDDRRLGCLMGIVALIVFFYSINRIIYRYHIKTKCVYCKSNNSIIESGKECIGTYTKDVVKRETECTFESRRRTEPRYSDASRWEYDYYTEQRVTSSCEVTKTYYDVKYNTVKVCHECSECGQKYFSIGDEMVGALRNYRCDVEYGPTSYKKGNWYRV